MNESALDPEVVGAVRAISHPRGEAPQRIIHDAGWHLAFGGQPNDAAALDRYFGGAIP